MNYFIAGTDTSAGKTRITALLLTHLRRQGKSAAGYKPVCSGSREDAHILQAVSFPMPELEAVNPLHFRSPLAPYAASLIENKPIRPADLVSGYEALAKIYETVLVEGAGGWETPLCPEFTMARLAQQLGLPVLLVVNNKLGALNHALLTLQSISSRGLECIGMVLNHVDEERDAASISNREVLRHFTKVPILGEVMHGAEEWDLEWSP
jgi:dethiobiotin synthetase